MLRRIAILAAIVAVCVWAWRNQSDWRGEVHNSTGGRLAGVTVILLKSREVTATTTTDKGGRFRLAAGLNADTALRIAICKREYMARLVDERPARQTGIGWRTVEIYRLDPAVAGRVDAGMAPFRSVLPAACR